MYAQPVEQSMDRKNIMDSVVEDIDQGDRGAREQESQSFGRHEYIKNRCVGKDIFIHVL